MLSILRLARLEAATPEIVVLYPKNKYIYIIFFLTTPYEKLGGVAALWFFFCHSWTQVLHGEGGERNSSSLKSLHTTIEGDCGGRGEGGKPVVNCFVLAHVNRIIKAPASP